MGMLSVYARDIMSKKSDDLDKLAMYAASVLFIGVAIYVFAGCGNKFRVDCDPTTKVCEIQVKDKTYVAFEKEDVEANPNGSKTEAEAESE